MRRFVRGLAACGALLWLGGCAGPGQFDDMFVQLQSAPTVDRGEYGADLAILRRAYFPPAHAGESNHLIDLYAGGSWKQFVAAQGLTNNRALFVIAHGKGIMRPLELGYRYAYYPDARLCGPRTPYFSARDLAAVVGPAAPEIHNILISGCNTEDALRPEELRRYFVNATNITHAPPGQEAFGSVFRHALVYPSKEVKLLYGMREFFGLDRTTQPDEKKPAPYVAALYTPGARTPYKTQTAGRELLQPTRPSEGY